MKVHVNAQVFCSAHVSTCMYGSEGFSSPVLGSLWLAGKFDQQGTFTCGFLYLV